MLNASAQLLPLRRLCALRATLRIKSRSGRHPSAAVIAALFAASVSITIISIIIEM